MFSHIQKYLLIFVFLLFLPLFFYRLGSTALLSYDEAWYAEITRNIVLTKNPLYLQFNGLHFKDHPHFGYILMAFPTLLFGSNEFSARFISAFLGAGSILLVFLIGKQLKHTYVGTIASAVLLSSMWFMFRARSGNLDIPYLFFALLTIFLLLSKSKHFLHYSAVSFACLFLIKTIAGVGVIPVGLYILWMRRKEWRFDDLTSAVGLATIIIFPWYFYNTLIDKNFLHHHFWEVGLRDGQNEYALHHVRQSLQYTAIGVGKWYKVFLVSIVLGVFSFFTQPKTRSSWFTLFFWFLGYSPFLFSSMTEVWHLIPLYPIMGLVIGLGLIQTLEITGKFSPWIQSLAVAGLICLASYQFMQFSNLIYPSENHVFSAERDISQKAGRYKNIHLVETFYPAAVYYSKQNVNPLHWDTSAYQIMVAKLQAKEDAVFIINQHLLNDLKKDSVDFAILEENSSYYLVGKVKEE